MNCSRDTWFTLFEAILGFVIGTIFGSLLGLALWYSVFVARLVEPFIVAINSVPKIALAPIVVLWFGTGLVSKVALSVSLTAIVALIAAYQAAKDADVDLQSLLISMGADKHQVFYKAVVPSTLPSIIATFRINVGFGLVGAVVGEFISSQRGLGHLIYTASSLYDLNTVWVGLFTLMIVGFVLYYVIDIIERTSLPWKQSSATHQVQVYNRPQGVTHVIAYAYSLCHRRAATLLGDAGCSPKTRRSSYRKPSSRCCICRLYVAINEGSSPNRAWTSPRKPPAHRAWRYPP